MKPAQVPSRLIFALMVSLILVGACRKPIPTPTYAPQPGDVASPTISYQNHNGTPQIASLENTDFHSIPVFPNAVDPNWIVVNYSPHVESLPFKALNGENWFVKVSCKYTHSNPRPVVCDFVIQPPNADTYEDDGIGYLGSDGHKRQAFIQTPNRQHLPGPPTFMIRDVN